MLFILFPIVVIVNCNMGESIKVISTDPSASLAKDDGFAVISDSSTKHLEDFTLCLRFMTYNFDVSREGGNRGYQSLISIYNFPLLNSFVGLSCQDHQQEDCDHFYKSLIPNWKRGKVYGRANFEFLPGWYPGEWRSVCMSGSSHTESWTTTFDGRPTVRSRYDGSHKNHEANIVLMNVIYKARQ